MATDSHPNTLPCETCFEIYNKMNRILKESGFTLLNHKFKQQNSSETKSMKPCVTFPVDGVQLTKLRNNINSVPILFNSWPYKYKQTPGKYKTKIQTGQKRNNPDSTINSSSINSSSINLNRQHQPDTINTANLKVTQGFGRDIPRIESYTNLHNFKTTQCKSRINALQSETGSIVTASQKVKHVDYKLLNKPEGVEMALKMKRSSVVSALHNEDKMHTKKLAKIKTKKPQQTHVKQHVEMKYSEENEERNYTLNTNNSVKMNKSQIKELIHNPKKQKMNQDEQYQLGGCSPASTTYTIRNHTKYSDYEMHLSNGENVKEVQLKDTKLKINSKSKKKKSHLLKIQAEAIKKVLKENDAKLEEEKLHLLPKDRTSVSNNRQYSNGDNSVLTKKICNDEHIHNCKNYNNYNNKSVSSSAFDNTQDSSPSKYRNMHTDGIKDIEIITMDKSVQHNDNYSLSPHSFAEKVIERITSSIPDLSDSIKSSLLSDIESICAQRSMFTHLENNNTLNVENPRIVQEIINNSNGSNHVNIDSSKKLPNSILERSSMQNSNFPPINLNITIRTDDRVNTSLSCSEKKNSLTQGTSQSQTVQKSCSLSQVVVEHEKENVISNNSLMSNYQIFATSTPNYDNAPIPNMPLISSKHMCDISIIPPAQSGGSLEKYPVSKNRNTDSDVILKRTITQKKKTINKQMQQGTKPGVKCVKNQMNCQEMHNLAVGTKKYRQPTLTQEFKIQRNKITRKNLQQPEDPSIMNNPIHDTANTEINSAEDRVCIQNAARSINDLGDNLIELPREPSVSEPQSPLHIQLSQDNNIGQLSQMIQKIEEWRRKGTPYLTNDIEYEELEILLPDNYIDELSQATSTQIPCNQEAFRQQQIRRRLYNPLRELYKNVNTLK